MALRKRNSCPKINMPRCIMMVSLLLFCCWNSLSCCMAFHLNEESNSVYPKVKLIPSSSFSHKRHSKTMEVFYQTGVSFSNTLYNLYLCIISSNGNSMKCNIINVILTICDVHVSYYQQWKAIV